MPTSNNRGTAPEGGPDYAHHRPSRYQTTASDQAQGDLLAYAQMVAEGARTTGLKGAERNDVEWCERVLEWLYDLQAGDEVCADDVRREFGSSPAMGSVFRTAGRRRILQPIGLKESTAITRHRGLQRRWVRT